MNAVMKAFAALHESAYGTKWISRRAQPTSAFGGKADIGQTCLMSAFDPKRMF
jgi:hypothetical protein